MTKAINGVYMLRCSDNTIYTGMTNNMKRRFQQHNSGKGANYTRNRTPVKLIFWENGFSHLGALEFEEKIKTLSKKSKLKLANREPYFIKMILKYKKIPQIQPLELQLASRNDLLNLIEEMREDITCTKDPLDTLLILAHKLKVNFKI